VILCLMDSLNDERYCSNPFIGLVDAAKLLGMTLPVFSILIRGRMEGKPSKPFEFIVVGSRGTLPRKKLNWLDRIENLGVDEGIEEAAEWERGS